MCILCSMYKTTQMMAKKLNAEQEAQLQRLKRDLGESEESTSSGNKELLHWPLEVRHV